MFVVDRAGQIRYRYYGASMSDIPANDEVLAALDALNAEAAAGAGPAALAAAG
jgi:hypothetical protein